MNATRGRPVDIEKQQEQKSKLVAAAVALLREKSYRSITIRELAQTAGVNSALVAYYFGNKEGLFIGMLDVLAKENFSKMKGVLASPEPIKAFIQAMLSMANQNAGTVKMIHDEIMTHDTPLRSAFIERFPKRMAVFLPQLLDHQIQAGLLDENINTKYAAFTLIGLIMMPFVAAPIREAAWEITADELKQPAWADNLYRMFLTGYGKRETNV